jgi:hypothetical protein
MQPQTSSTIYINYINKPDNFLELTCEISGMNCQGHLSNDSRDMAENVHCCSGTVHVIIHLSNQTYSDCSETLWNVMWECLGKSLQYKPTCSRERKRNEQRDRNYLPNTKLHSFKSMGVVCHITTLRII